MSENNIPGKKVKITAKMPVVCWEEKITIPIQGPTQQNPLPHFKGTYEPGDNMANYPYSLAHTAFTRHISPADREWNMIFLENRYIRLMISPELGGRIYSMIDKTTGRECFHYNQTVKYMHGGFGGLYASGGKELNYPQAHSTTNCRDKEYKIVENDDDSVTVYISELDLLNRTHWQFSYTIEADSSYVKEEFRAYNRHFTPAPFLFWNNAGVKTEKGSRFLYSENYGLQHGGSTNFTYPWFRGYNLAAFEDVPSVLGIYMYNMVEGLVAHYNKDIKHGVARWGDPAGPTGKKYWCWGMNTPEGILKKHVISGNNEQYAEIQSGYIENQDHFEIINPLEEIRFEEYWFPIKEIGEPVLSSKYGALAIEHEIIDGKIFANLGFAAATKIVNGNFSVVMDDKKLLAESFSIDANEVIIHKIPLQNKTDIDRLKITITNNGQQIINFSIAEDKTPALLTQYEQQGGEYSPIEAKNNPDVMTQMGKWQEKLGFNTKAETLYRKVLSCDEKHAEANRCLGILLYKKALHQAAYECFDRSALRDPYNGQTYYYMALNALEDNNRALAKRAARQAVRSREPELGSFILGIIAMQEREFTPAIEYFEKARGMNSYSSRTAAYLALAYKKLGRVDDAKNEISRGLAIAPTDALLQSEASRDLTAQFNILHQPYIELACDYIMVGCFNEALNIIEIGIKNIPHTRPVAMLFYYQGYILNLLKLKNKAQLAFEQAANAELNFVFPFRMESFKVLKSALKYNAHDSHALTFLGMLLYQRERFIDGHSYFKQAVEFDKQNWLASRNLGLYNWKIANNLELACAIYDEIIKYCPENYFIYQEYCSLLQQAGKNLQVIIFLEEIWHITSLNRGLAAQLVNSFVAVDNLAKAVDVIHNVKLHASNEGFGDIAFPILKKYGDQLFMSKNYDKAIAIYGETLIEHENFQQGPFNFRWFAEAHYKIGLCYKKLQHLDDAKKSFKQAIAEDAMIAWRALEEDGIWINRYYQAMAMLELNMTVEAHITLDGFVEFYRMLIEGNAPVKPIIAELAMVAKEKYKRCLETSRKGFDAEI